MFIVVKIESEYGLEIFQKIFRTEEEARFWVLVQSKLEQDYSKEEYAVFKVEFDTIEVGKFPEMCHLLTAEYSEKIISLNKPKLFERNYCNICVRAKEKCCISAYECYKHNKIIGLTVEVCISKEEYDILSGENIIEKNEVLSKIDEKAFETYKNYKQNI